MFRLLNIFSYTDHTTPSSISISVHDITSLLVTRNTVQHKLVLSIFSSLFFPRKKIPPPLKKRKKKTEKTVYDTTYSYKLDTAN